MMRVLLVLSVLVVACGEGDVPPHVGSTDCETLVAASGELTLDLCLECQEATCGANASCDGNFPCVDGKIRIQGCAEDEDCEGVSPFCGRYTGVDDVCVLVDDM